MIEKGPFTRAMANEMTKLESEAKEDLELHKGEQKPSNPKDALGSTRIDLGILSSIALSEEALAMTEGMVKYGKWNYRAVGVRVSIYLAAAMRHILKYRDGQDRDPKTGVHHLGSARACLGVIFESLGMGNLVDDRPPAMNASPDYIDGMESRVKHLQEMFKDSHPKHYTIKDELQADPLLEV